MRNLTRCVLAIAIVVLSTGCGTGSGTVDPGSTPLTSANTETERQTQDAMTEDEVRQAEEDARTTTTANVPADAKGPKEPVEDITDSTPLPKANLNDPESGPMHALCYAMSEPARLILIHASYPDETRPKHLESTVQALIQSLEDGLTWTNKVYAQIPDDVRPFADYLIQSRESSVNALREGVTSEEGLWSALKPLVETEEDSVKAYEAAALVAGCPDTF